MNIRHVRLIAALSAFCLAAILFLTALWAFLQPLEFDRRIEWVELKIAALLPQTPHPEFVPTPLSVSDIATSTPPAPIPIAPSATSTLARASVTPSATRRPAPTSTPMTALPPRIVLSNFRHDYQRFNNCGPATLAIWLSHVGRNETQYELAPILKGSKDDRNVSPDEVAALVSSYGFRTLVRVNGDSSTLKALLAQGIPVLIENWFVPRTQDASGHYRLLTGYDDTGTASTRSVGLSVEFDGAAKDYPQTETGYFIAQDSYIGPNIKLPYHAWDRDWRVFNRTYLVFYTDAQASIVKSIVGDDMSDAVMYAGATSVAQRDVDANPNDGYAWFDLGSSLVGLGKYDSAGRAFDRARQLKLPWRMMWYQFGAYEAYLKSGRYDEVIALAEATLVNNPLSEEALYYRGLAQLALGRKDAARVSFQKAIEANPRFVRAKQALDGMGS